MISYGNSRIQKIVFEDGREAEISIGNQESYDDEYAIEFSGREFDDSGNLD